MRNRIEAYNKLLEYRRDLETIDETILKLLITRFQVVGKVRHAKRALGVEMNDPQQELKVCVSLAKIAKLSLPEVTLDSISRLWRPIFETGKLLARVSSETERKR